MPSFPETVNATLDPLVEKALKVAAEHPGVTWAVGFRAAYNHDFFEDKNGKLEIGIAPGAPVPITASVSAGIDRQVHDTTNLQVYFLFSSSDAPTIDTVTPPPPSNPALPGIGGP